MKNHEKANHLLEIFFRNVELTEKTSLDYNDLKEVITLAKEQELINQEDIDIYLNNTLIFI